MSSASTIDEQYNFDYSVQKEYNSILGRAEECLDNIESFAEEVAKDLARFEAENMNVYKLIEEEHKIVENLIDKSFEQINQFENRLDVYERSLVNIRSNFNELEHYSSWELNQQNKVKLMQTLSEILRVVDLSNEDLENIFDINATTLSPELDRLSLQLIDVYQGNIPEGAIHVKAIKDQIDFDFQVIKSFCEKFSKIIDELIISKFKAVTRYIPSTREDVHNIINIYAPIMSRVKILDPYKYSEICDNYCRDFNQGYKNEWDNYFNNFINLIPFYDTSKYKKEGHSIVYREEKEFKERCKSISEHIKNILILVSRVSNELRVNANKFLQLITREEIAQNLTADPLSQTRKRGGGEIKLDKMIKIMLDFIFPLMLSYFNELDRNDFFYMASLYSIFNEVNNEKDENRFYSQLLSSLLSDSNDRIKNLSSIFCTQLEQKRTKKGNVSEILKLFKEFLLSMSYIIPKQLEDSSPISILLKDVLNTVIDAVGYSYIETSEKVSKEIFLIENLYNLQVCVGDVKISILSEDRKKIKQKYSDEIEKWVKGSITNFFSKLIVLIEEIDKKVAAQCTLSAIQAYVQSSRTEYKKCAKDFTFKNVKKVIEKTHKTVKKQFTDPALFTTIWHLMSIEIISHISKIHYNLTTYCSKIQEINVDFSISDLKQYISSVDMSGSIS